MKNKLLLFVILIVLLSLVQSVLACKNKDNTVILQTEFDNRCSVSITGDPDSIPDNNTLTIKLDSVDRIELESLDSLNSELSLVDVEEDGIIIFACPEPVFPGGKKAMLNYFKSCINIEISNINAFSATTVYVRFTINEKGEVEDAIVVKGENIELNSIALKAVNEMPNWIPVEINGKKYKTNYTIPIHFCLH